MHHQTGDGRQHAGNLYQPIYITFNKRTLSSIAGRWRRVIALFALLSVSFIVSAATAVKPVKHVHYKVHITGNRIVAPADSNIRKKQNVINIHATNQNAISIPQAAPVINYPTPLSFTTGIELTKILPTNVGGEVRKDYYGVTTLAGTGRTGNNVGPAQTATFNALAGIAIDQFGTVYIADAGSHCIKKIKNQQVTILAGSGTPGYANGTGSAAKFNLPSGIDIDSAGNVYVADRANNMIRKVSPTGVVTTIAGSTVAGLANGISTAARFRGPTDVKRDYYGNLFVADVANKVVRRITPAGEVTTIGEGVEAYSNGTGSATIFGSPRSLALDRFGNVYILDVSNYQVRQVTPGGIIKTMAGSGTRGNADGKGTAASFMELNSITIDTLRNLYVTDMSNHNIRKIDSTGVTSTFAGTGTDSAKDSLPLQSGFFAPDGIMASKYGDLYIADSGNNKVRKITISGFTIDKPLPAGINFDPTSGLISGKPTVLSPATIYTVTAHNIKGQGAAILNIKVDGTLSFPPFSPAIYGQPDLDGATSTSGVITYQFSNPNVARVVAGKIHITAAGVTTVIASNGGYTLSQLLQVAPAPLLIIADNKTKAFDTPNPALTARYMGFVNGDATTNLNALPMLSTNATQASVPGEYVITPDSALAANYTITYQAGKLTVVPRSAPDAAQLTALTISAGTLSPEFKSDSTNYSASVPEAISAITITPVLKSADAIVKVNGQAVVSGSASVPVELVGGSNTIMVIVTANDSVTTKTYTLKVTRALSSNASLNNLTVSSGAISPAFSSNILAYVALVANNISTIKVTSKLSDVTATIKVNGAAVLNGSPSADIPLAVGLNIITVAVTAQNGTVKTYTIRVNRAASSNAELSGLALSAGVLSPAFTASTINYTAAVANPVAAIKITATTSDTTATFKVNGVTVESGKPSQNLALTVGNNTFTVQVMAQNGSSKQYVVTVTRASNTPNAGLAALTISSGTLSPAFKTDTLAYNAQVANSVTSITVTPSVIDAAATIKVNGILVATGVASPAIPLATGGNTISIVVTAKDGVTVKNYTITVTRGLSANAGLAGLRLSSGSLSPVFAPGIFEYTVSVAAATSFVTVTPILANATASVTVNGAAVASGGNSAAIGLATGVNLISVNVTAQDGSKKAYVVRVTREQAVSTNGDLRALAISAGTLSPAFNPNVTAYQVIIENSVTSLTVTPFLSDSTATVKVDGKAVANNTASAPVSLPPGDYSVIVAVRAQNGSFKNYIINIFRAAGLSNANLVALTVNRGTLSPAFKTDSTAYKVAVGNTITSINITPTASDDKATLKVNGVTQANGAQSAPISLNFGATRITVEVKAKDNTTTKTYTVTVTRAIPDIYAQGQQNFTVTGVAAACRGSANGAINIVAAKALNYSAVVTGTGFNTTYPFGKSVKVENLAAGTYSVCIYVAGQPEHQLCYSVIVGQPADLAVYSVINKNDQSITLALSGADHYSIRLNGTDYTTNDQSITLPLVEGSNQLSITTDRLCQGTFEQVFNFSGKVMLFPVPFQNTLNVDIGKTIVKDALVEIHNVADGRLVFAKRFTNASGILLLDAGELKGGVYALHLTLDNTKKIFKIVKK